MSIHLNSNQLRSSMITRHASIRRERLAALEQETAEIKSEIEKENQADYLRHIAELKRNQHI